MPKVKRVAGNTGSPMKLMEEKAKLEAELLAAKEELGKVRSELVQQKPLLVDAMHALAFTLKHPDFQVGGKFHQGALGTTMPVLKRLCEAAGVELQLVAEQKRVQVPAEPAPAADVTPG
jgi:hypothetical protein